MKLLISLLLIISITIISWSSCAKSTKIQVNAIYYQASYTTNPLILNPIFSHKYSNEDFAVTSNQSTNKAHNFFELAIIFNEKLQQFIAFFTNLVEEVDSSELSSVIHSLSKNLPLNSSYSSNSQPAIKKCKVSS